MIETGWKDYFTAVEAWLKQMKPLDEFVQNA